jgi:hypothetical protein
MGKRGEGRGREGKGREGKGREGKGRAGQGREGKGPVVLNGNKKIEVAAEADLSDRMP